MPVESLRVPDREGWTSLIDAWGSLLDRYETATVADEDVAYWHREESLTALLATAAWQSGGIGVVEFETQRHRMLKEQSGAGAGDAWLRVGKSWYALEAKLCWVPDEIKSNLEAAQTDLSTLAPGDRADFGVALCYCVPSIKGKARDGLIATLARDLGRRFPESSLVVAYTTQRRPAPEHQGCAYPGLVMVGKVIEWKPKTDKRAPNLEH